MFTEGFKISSPYTCDNLSVFLISGEDRSPGVSYITLEEAMRHKLLVVHETETVGELAVENVSTSFEVFIQAGDIVKGGLQDRVLVYDMVIPAKSGRMPVSAFCVEHGRWNSRGKEAAAEFKSSSERVHSRDLKVAMHRNSQSEVWEKVEAAQIRLSDQIGADVRGFHSPSSLQLTLENKDIEARIKRYTEALSGVTKGDNANVVGYAVAINGKMNGAEIYSSRELFDKLWPKLLKASAVEALSENDDAAEFVPATVGDVSGYLNEVGSAEMNAHTVTSRVRVVLRESAGTVCQETRDEARGGDWIHRSWVSKDVA